jgi:hypothetical protein
MEGLFYGSIGLAAGLAGTWALHAWPPYRKLTVSVKTAAVRPWCTLIVSVKMTCAKSRDETYNFLVSASPWRSMLHM